MDKYSKFVLSVIAVCLIGINVHLFKNSFISIANAIESHTHYLSDVPHSHFAEHLPINLDGDQKKLGEIIKILMINNHNHFWQND